MLENQRILTALITPFTDKNEIDYLALDALTDRLIQEHSDGFVIGATTGESPTLTHDEKIELFNHFTTYVGNRAVVVANVGNNNTAESVNLAREVSAIAGITAVLAVNPYYSKPSQAGMKAHFIAIAEASAVPVMLYNIPGRTVVRLDNETLIELAKHPNIQGVKQCTTVSDLQYLVEHTDPDFAVYTGEDTQTLAALRVGARGVISVASHVYGNEMHDMITAAEHGEDQLADEKMAWLAPRMDAFFAFPSPAPVKMVLAARGEIRNNLRLPMIPLTKNEAAEVNTILEAE